MKKGKHDLALLDLLGALHLLEVLEIEGICKCDSGRWTEDGRYFRVDGRCIIHGRCIKDGHYIIYGRYRRWTLASSTSSLCWMCCKFSRWTLFMDETVVDGRYFTADGLKRRRDTILDGP